MHIRRWEREGAVRHLLALLVELAEVGGGGVVAPVDVVEHRHQPRATILLRHDAVVRRVLGGAELARAVADCVKVVRVELVRLCVVHCHQAAAPVHHVVRAVVFHLRVAREAAVDANHVHRRAVPPDGLARVVSREDAGLEVLARLLLGDEALGLHELVAEEGLAVLEGDGRHHAVAVQVALREVVTLALEVRRPVAQQRSQQLRGDFALDGALVDVAERLVRRRHGAVTRAVAIVEWLQLLDRLARVQLRAREGPLRGVARAPWRCAGLVGDGRRCRRGGGARLDVAVARRLRAQRSPAVHCRGARARGRRNARRRKR
mmetsp:Transcript_20552/g.63718  ORF Transcript_20552/g.63718 Transcript_20552/m.63718 type:complete len:319 (-) Transcript_20552:106-1062(-)